MKLRDRLTLGGPIWKDMIGRIDALVAKVNALTTLANDLKTQYEAHRVLTTSSVHGAADATNVVTAADVSSTAVETLDD